MSADLDAQGRYQAVLDALSEREPAWIPLVDHSVALSFSGEELKVAFASEFQAGRGRARLQSAELRPVLARAFPGLQRVEAVVRSSPDGRGPTRHETRKRLRALELRKLREDVETDPVIARLRNQLGLEILKITPLEPKENSP